MGERCCCQEDGDTWSSLDLFFPPYFTSSQSFFLFFLFAGFLLTLCFFCDSYPFRILPGWFTGTLGVLLSFCFFCFLSNTVFLVWVLRWFRTTDSCFCNGNLSGKIVLFRAMETRIVLFLIVLTTLDRQKDKTKCVVSPVTFIDTPTHTPIEPHNQNHGLRIFLFFCIYFVLRFGKRLNTWWKNISAFFVFFAGVDRLGWILGYQRTTQTRHNTTLRLEPKAGGGLERNNENKGGRSSQPTSYFEVSPLFPTASSSHSTIFGRLMHSFIPPFSFVECLFLIDQDDHGYFWLWGKGKRGGNDY